MKKICTLFFILFFLNSCWNEKNESVIIEEVEEQKIEFTVWTQQNKYKNVYWNILNNSTNILTSTINWKISYLNCESWIDVNTDTVIAVVEPDKLSLSYKNNLVQINTLKNQLKNLEQIKETTIYDFEVKLNQLNLQKNEIKNQLTNVDNNVWDNNKWLNNQLVIINDSISLLEKNKLATLKNIEDSILNLKKSWYNSLVNWIKRLDEIFWITNKNKSLNNDYERYLWVKDATLKQELEAALYDFIGNSWDYKNNFSKFWNEELSQEFKKISDIFTKASDVVENSIESKWAITKVELDWLYKEMLWFSEWFVTLKSNLDNLINTTETTILTFDTQMKELEQAKSQLTTSLSNLGTSKNTILTNSENLEEQFKNLENTKQSTIREIENNILSLKQAISQLNISFEKEVIYAGVVWTIKTKNSSQNNNVWIWSPVCTVVPQFNSLKFEIYSPNKLKKWDEFIYLKDWINFWTWTIISESPVRNSITQNFSYEWNINFDWFKEGDYLDVKVLTESEEWEIWIPIEYVFPMLDWYYANIVWKNEIETVKIKVWKMNNWEILILEWLEFWDTLTK